MKCMGRRGVVPCMIGWWTLALLCGFLVPSVGLGAADASRAAIARLARAAEDTARQGEWARTARAYGELAVAYGALLRDPSLQATPAEQVDAGIAFLASGRTWEGIYGLEAAEERGLDAAQAHRAGLHAALGYAGLGMGDKACDALRAAWGDGGQDMPQPLVGAVAGFEATRDARALHRALFAEADVWLRDGARARGALPGFDGSAASASEKTPLQKVGEGFLKLVGVVILVPLIVISHLPVAVVGLL